MRASRILLASAVSVLALAGCGGHLAPTPLTSYADVTATFAAPGGVATTYDPTLVPIGATAAITSKEADGATTITLKVTGLQPNRSYGAHAHVNPCGPDAMAAGPHYQYRTDPVTPSVDPAFANPENEVWLDFTTDGSGAGSATSTVPWTFPADRRAKSVVVHEKPTSTEPGMAGTAGARPGCVTVEF